MLAKTISTFVLLILIGTVILGSVYLFDKYYVIKKTDKIPDSENQDKCAILGGNFVEEYNECEGISRESCESLNGEFNECASACRHDSEEVVCTMQCVQVCSF